MNKDHDPEFYDDVNRDNYGQNRNQNTFGQNRDQDTFGQNRNQDTFDQNRDFDSLNHRSANNPLGDLGISSDDYLLNKPGVTGDSSYQNANSGNENQWDQPGAAGDSPYQNANLNNDNQPTGEDRFDTPYREQNNQNGFPAPNRRNQGAFEPELRVRRKIQKYLGTPSDQMVIFSSRAFNAIISETFAKHPKETGGILLGHVLDNGFWIVTEAIPPGKDSINQYAYFEYDTEFVNYVANRVAIQYKLRPQVLGLWHRHPGSMDSFSGTDDGTNLLFANANDKANDRDPNKPKTGAISGLVNIDPDFRITIYHVANIDGRQVQYQKMGYEVGDEMIPEEYFQLNYFGTTKPAESYGENNLLLPDSTNNQATGQDDNGSPKGWKFVNTTLEILLIFMLAVNMFLLLKPDAKTGSVQRPQTSDTAIQPQGFKQNPVQQPPVQQRPVQQTGIANRNDSKGAVDTNRVSKSNAIASEQGEMGNDANAYQQNVSDDASDIFSDSDLNTAADSKTGSDLVTDPAPADTVPATATGTPTNPENTTNPVTPTNAASLEDTGTSAGANPVTKANDKTDFPLENYPIPETDAAGSGTPTQPTQPDQMKNQGNRRAHPYSSEQDSNNL